MIIQKSKILVRVKTLESYDKIWPLSTLWVE